MPGFLAETLTWNKHYAYTLAVQTAISMGHPPTFLITKDGQPTDKWTAADKKLALAWTILNKETCKNCGNPLWICHSENKNLGFKVKIGHCYAKGELDKWQDKDSKKKKSQLKDGDFTYVQAHMYDDSPMPSRREWLEQMTEE